ncbi:MAG: lysophospholipid acyltransferase family protein [candidate division WS1 bacterium]|jgi:KDO2-lipid IV(A) lauroyltransferase|nr:lysophospholipid acyltransferase family protein [candidate division WS1 bacterium]
MSREKSKLRRRIERALTRCAAAGSGFLARFLPLSALRALADGVAFLLRLLAPSRQRGAAENMRRVFGERYTNRQYRALAAEVTRGVCRTMMELLKLPYLSRERVVRLVSLEGSEHVTAALARGQGVILLTGHYGNWELMGARMCDEGWPLTVIARDSEESFTAEMINAARRSHGVEVLEREDLRAMLRCLRANRILGVLPDQHAAFGGLIVDFLGRPAATAVGPATLALRTGAAIVPGFCVRQPDGTFHVRFFPALEVTRSGDRGENVRAITLACNEILGREIRAHPEQWLWLHRRWKVDNDRSASPVAPDPASPEGETDG